MHGEHVQHLHVSNLTAQGWTLIRVNPQIGNSLTEQCGRKNFQISGSERMRGSRQ